jgi:hypothetical protein
MSFLKTLADSGQAILCTYAIFLLCAVVILATYSQCSIHQPSAKLSQVSDGMLLLRKGE